MVPARPVHLAARAAEHGAVDGERDRRVGTDEALDQEVEHEQAEAVGAPGGAGEEVVGAGVVQAAGESRRLPHPGDRALADAAEEAVDQRPEDLEGRGAEGGAEQGQDRGERRWQGGHRRRPPRRVLGHIPRSSKPPLLPAPIAPSTSRADLLQAGQRSRKSRINRKTTKFGIRGSRKNYWSGIGDASRRTSFASGDSAARLRERRWEAANRARIRTPRAAASPRSARRRSRCDRP